MNIVFYCICFVLLLSAPNMMTNEFSLNNDTYQKCNFFKNSKFRTEIQKPFRNMSIKQKKTKLNRQNELCYPFSISPYISEIHSHELDSLQILIKQFIFVIVFLYGFLYLSLFMFKSLL